MWRVPDSPLARSQGHRSIPENPFVAGVWRFRATLYEGKMRRVMWRVTGHNDRPTIKDTGGVRPARCGGAADPCHDRGQRTREDDVVHRARNPG